MKKRRAEAIWIDSRSRWQINVQREGQRKTFTSSTAGRLGKHEAEAKADKWLERYSTEQRLGDAWEMFITDKSREITKRAAQNLQSCYKHITETIPANKRLSMITLYDWQQVLEAMAADGYAAGTIGLTLSAITALNSYALARRWECEEIREGQLTVPKQAGKAKIKQALSEAAYKALFALDDTDNTYIYLFQFLPLTGLRIGEALTLQWDDISGGILHLRRALNADGEVGEGKTANAQRNIPIIPQAQSILDEQRAFCKRWRIKSDLIFPAIDGIPLTYHQACTNWARVARQIKTSCTLHELRHTYISIVKSVLPLPLLKQIVGHSGNMDTLGVYGHELADDAAQSAAYIKQAFADR